MRTIRQLGIVAAVVALAAACDMDDMSEDTLPGAETAAEQPQGEAPSAAEAPAALIRVDSMADGGAYLTDVRGRALYLLEGEPSDSATCYDACAEEWPPFVATAGTPEASDAAQGDLIGTIERRDGQQQVTYGGHPLYYYHDDQGPGDTTGQDVTDQWGEWYLVRPSGEPLEEGGGAGAGAENGS